MDGSGLVPEKMSALRCRNRKAPIIYVPQGSHPSSFSIILQSFLQLGLREAQCKRFIDVTYALNCCIPARAHGLSTELAIRPLLRP
jgi:hypothetical protein